MSLLSKASSWCAAATAGVLLTGGVAVCSAQSVTAGVGATNISNYYYAFVTATDGNLWLRTDYPGAAPWENLSHPSGVSIATPIGVTPRDSAAYEFIIGSDGNLWLNNDNAGSWPWTNMHTPSGVRIAGAVGAVTSSGQPFAYVIGNDGNVWENNYNGSGAWVWQKVGKPPSATLSRGLGVISYASNYPSALVLDTANNVWNAQWNGSTYVWTNESNIGAGVSGPAGEFLGYDETDGQSNIIGTVILNSNGLLVVLSRVVPGNYADSGKTCVSTVATSGIAKVVGVDPVGNIYAIGSDGHLLGYTFAGNFNGSAPCSGGNTQWSWRPADLGLSPNGVAFDLPVGVISNPWAFATDNSGELWGWNPSGGFVPLTTP